MLKVFNSNFKITQGFGEDFYWMNDNPPGRKGKLTYKSMGLKGHNGVDLIPSGTDRSLFCTFSGFIMIMKNDGGYGNRIAIWNREKRRTEYFNHLDSFNPDLKLGKPISAGTFIGVMGNTGLSTGPHLHYALAETDEAANRINRDNGYGGYIDPISYLKSGVL